MPAIEVNQIPKAQLEKILKISTSHRKLLVDILGTAIGESLVKEIQNDYQRALNKRLFDSYVNKKNTGSHFL